MKKQYALFLLTLLVSALLCGCVGTTVVVGGDCTCSETEPYVPEAGEVKTGLGVLTTATASDGKISYQVLMAAVAVDEKGIITDCVIDGVSADVQISSVTEAWTQEVQTKNELGKSYGMVTWGGAKYEWNVQAENFASYVKGKTAQQVAGVAVTESGKPADSDLAASVTISIGDFMQVVQLAVANAQYGGADSADELVLAATPTLSGEKDSYVQLEMDVTALNRRNGKITACTIDGVQAKVEFQADGSVTTELPAAFKTKKELGDDYGMVAWGGARYEWYEQAENFAGYVVGKTGAEVSGIAVSESGKPTDSDLVASVTISIGGFQTLIGKAMQ